MNQLRLALKGLPADLDETYKRILVSIREEDIRYAVRILRWLAFSPRPLLLVEVAEIAAIDANPCPAFDQGESLQDPLEVLSICSSLVTLIAVNGEAGHGSRHGRSAVLLAHYSVKEYLVSERILDSEASLYGLNSSLCHQLIEKYRLMIYRRLLHLVWLFRERMLGWEEADFWVGENYNQRKLVVTLVTTIIRPRAFWS